MRVFFSGLQLSRYVNLQLGTVQLEFGGYHQSSAALAGVTACRYKSLNCCYYSGKYHSMGNSSGSEVIRLHTYRIHRTASCAHAPPTGTVSDPVEVLMQSVAKHRVHYVSHRHMDWLIS